MRHCCVHALTVKNEKPDATEQDQTQLLALIVPGKERHAASKIHLTERP